MTIGFISSSCLNHVIQCLMDIGVAYISPHAHLVKEMQKTGKCEVIMTDCPINAIWCTVILPARPLSFCIHAHGWSRSSGRRVCLVVIKTSVHNKGDNYCEPCCLWTTGVCCFFPKKMYWSEKKNMLRNYYHDPFLHIFTIAHARVCIYNAIIHLSN